LGGGKKVGGVEKEGTTEDCHGGVMEEDITRRTFGTRGISNEKLWWKERHEPLPFGS